MAVDLSTLLANNARYVQARCGVPPLQPVPAEGMIIVTCMDVRIDPLDVLGLAPGSAHVLRNAGARATEDVVRSIVVSTKLMATDHVVVMGHTQCGLAAVTNLELGELVAHSYASAEFRDGQWQVDGRNQGALAGRGYDFMAITDVTQSVASDVFKLKWHPLMPPDTRIDGLVYDVVTGAVSPVPGVSSRPTPSPAQVRPL